MCGITGIINLKNKPVKTATLRRMTSSIAHRGPNGEGLYIEKNIGLGHRRLSIIDLSERGSQPMWNKKKNLVITFNGEIYNYLELKKEIGGKYESDSDTEVLLRAYETWGEDCLQKLNGIFAFAIWDEKNQKLFIARDHLGVKPLYYAIHKDVLYFASEIKAILKAGVPAKPNDHIIHDYLVYGFYDHSEETFFEGIKQIMPGHFLAVKKGITSLHEYWKLAERVKALTPPKPEDAPAIFLNLLKDAVKIQLRSDVPIGLSVSGGLDSSMLTAVVHDIAKGQKNFDIFHFTYEGQGYESEIPSVSELAARLGWRRPIISEIAPKDIPALADKIMWHEEQPYPGLPTFAWHKLYSDLSKTKNIVTLEGHGGDEIMAGYDYFIGSFLLDVIRTKGAKEMLSEYGKIAAVRGLKPEALLPFFVNTIEATFTGGVSADGSQFSYKQALNQKFLAKNFPQPIFPEPFDSYLTNMQYRELKYTKLPRALRSVDRESMAFGRELRVPILDYRLVEFALSLPPEAKIHGGHLRYAMREAAKKIIPKTLAETPKRSLPNPMRAWFQDELKTWLRGILASKSFGARPYFDQKKVLQEFDRYCFEKNPQNAFHIWQWVSIELWFRNFIDKK